MTDIATSEVLISELATKEVTLAPKQATVVREIPTKIQVTAQVYLFIENQF